MACLEDVLKKFPDIDKEEVERVEKALGRVKRKLQAEGRLSELEEVLKKEVKKEIQTIEITATELARNQALIELKDAVITERIAAARDFKGAEPIDGLMSFTGRSNKGFKGAQSGIDGLTADIEAKLVGDWMLELQEFNPRYVSLFNNKQFNRDVLFEMFEFEKGNKKSITGNVDAFEFANITRKHKSIAVGLMNEEGAFIREIDAHVMAQSHNPKTIMKLGKNLQEAKANYKVLMKRLLNHEKTFGNDVDPDAFLEGVFENITSNNHSLFLSTVRGEDVTTKGAGRTATGLSRGRKLHFKDAQSFLEYNDLHGTSMPIQGISNSFHNAAKHTAVMRTFGPDSANMFTKHLNAIVKEAKKTAEHKKFYISEKKQKGLKKQFDELTGVAIMPEDPTLAGWVAGIKNINSMIGLGKVLISSIVDIPANAGNLHYNGVGWLSSYHEVFKGIGRTFKRAKDKEIAIDIADAFIESVRGSLATRHNLGGVTGSGMVANATTNFFKLNGLTYWTGLMKEGHSFALSRHIAKHMSHDYSALGKKVQRMLKKHDISEREWGLIKQSKTVLENGEEMVLPRSIQDLDSKLFKNKTEQRDLESKLRSLFIEESNTGTPTPGVKERAFARTGAPGSIMGSAGELLWQFKMFPLTMMSRVLPRQMEDGVGNLARFIGMTTLFGYAALTLKDMAKGRSPRNPMSNDVGQNVKLFTDSMLNGGSLGVFGDFLFQDFNVYGRDFLSTLAGPTFGRVNDIASIFALARQGEISAGAKAMQLLKRNVPFGNLFYTEALLNYAIMNQLQEWLNPGSMDRVEKRLEEDNNQEVYGHGQLFN